MQAFDKIEADFPVSVRAMLENLQCMARERSEGEFKRAGMGKLLASILEGGGEANALAGEGGAFGMQPGQSVLNPKQQEVRGYTCDGRLGLERS